MKSCTGRENNVKPSRNNYDKIHYIVTESQICSFFLNQTYADYTNEHFQSEENCRTKFDYEGIVAIVSFLQ